MIRSLRRHCVLAVLAGMVPVTLAADEPGFEPLFDGKSLSGWEGNLDVFRVEDNTIIGGSLTEKIPRNEFLCTTREYEDFELRLDAKLTGEGNNAGIQIRSQRIPNHHEVIGYQCDMGSAWNRSIWGALYDESRRRKVLAEGKPEDVAKATKTDDWNQFVVRCVGPRVQIWLNGCATVDFTEEDDSISRKGIIALQIHGGKPAEARYRNIRIKELSSP